MHTENSSYISKYIIKINIITENYKIMHYIKNYLNKNEYCVNDIIFKKEYIQRTFSNKASLLILFSK